MLINKAFLANKHSIALYVKAVYYMMALGNAIMSGLRSQVHDIPEMSIQTFKPTMLNPSL